MDSINEAIETIKGYCSKFRSCKTGCRFYNDENGCVLQNTIPPMEWEILIDKKEASE